VGKKKRKRKERKKQKKRAKKQNQTSVTHRPSLGRGEEYTVYSFHKSSALGEGEEGANITHVEYPACQQ